MFFSGGKMQLPPIGFIGLEGRLAQVLDAPGEFSIQTD